MTACVLTIPYWAGHVRHGEPMWRSTWAEVSLNGSNLGPSCAMLDPSWAEVGAKWEFGPKLGPCWPKLALCGSPSCGNAGSKPTISTMKMAPPQRRLCLFISSAAKLPRLGTFSPGGFCGLPQPTHPKLPRSDKICQACQRILERKDFTEANAHDISGLTAA